MGARFGEFTLFEHLVNELIVNDNLDGLVGRITNDSLNLPNFDLTKLSHYKINHSILIYQQ